MMSKVALWSGFGIAVRLWQLGLEMRPLFNASSLWVYPVYGTIGGSFGYWLTGVEQKQLAYLQERRDALLEKRRRRAERLKAAGVDVTGDEFSAEESAPLVEAEAVATVQGKGVLESLPGRRFVEAVQQEDESDKAVE